MRLVSIPELWGTKVGVGTPGGGWVAGIIGLNGLTDGLKIRTIAHSKALILILTMP